VRKACGGENGESDQSDAELHKRGLKRESLLSGAALKSALMLNGSAKFNIASYIDAETASAFA
jgi:hypothetical protein